MASPLTVEVVLVPVDGSDESTTAVEYAASIAGVYDATVHVMYVFGETVGRAIETGTVDPDDVAAEGLSYIDALDPILDGVSATHSIAYGFSTKRLRVHPGSVVLDTADQIDADFLVVPRDPGREDAADVLEKTAEYVLLYASQPVLSV